MMITWRDDRRHLRDEAKQIGFIGRIAAFDLMVSTRVDTTAAGGQVRLICRLPKYEQNVHFHKTRDDAQDHAASIYAAWLRDAGLVEKA